MSNDDKKRDTSALQVEEDEAQIRKKTKTAQEPWEHSLNTNISVIASLEWPASRCIRELLLNCTDEDVNTEVKRVDERTWKITNKVKAGRGSLRKENFGYASNIEKVGDRFKNGKFGYGLKDAVVLLTARGIHYVARSCNGSFAAYANANGDVFVRIDPNDRISDGVEQSLSISGDNQLDLDREIKRAEEQCIAFRVRSVYKDFDAVEVSDSDSARTPLGTVYMPRTNSQDEVECDGTTELFVHGCAYSFSGDETNKRKPLALIYNLHVDKATIEGRDRAGLPKNWEPALSKLIKEAPDSVFNRLLLLRKSHADKFYEFSNQHISHYINLHVLAQREEAERICAESARAREDAERAVVEQTEARRQVQLCELKWQKAETEQVPTIVTRRNASELAKSKENAYAATLRVEQLQATAVAKATEAEKVARSADPTVLLFPDDGNVGDMKVQPIRIPNAKHSLWSNGEVPWIEEFSLMESAHIDRKYTPLFRQLRRLLYVLGLKDRVAINKQTDSSVTLVVLRDSTLYVRFDAAAEMHVLRAAILQLSAAGLYAELSGHTSEESVAQVASLILQLTPAEPAVVANCSAKERPAYLGQLLSGAAVSSFCPLLVATEWDTKFGGISSFNIQLAKGLAAELRQAGGTSAQCQPVVFIMVLGTDEIDEATHKQWQEAAVLGIKIVDGSLYRGVYTPCLTCGEFARITHIVGHAHITGDEAAGMRRLPQLKHAKLWQINHVLPVEVDPLKEEGTAQLRQQSARKKEAGLKKLNKEADHVFSVGEMMYEHFESHLHTGSRIPYTSHTQLILPLNPDFYKCPTERTDFPVVRGTIHILYFGRTDSAMYVKGVDIAMRTVEQISKDNAFVNSGRRIKLTIRGTKIDTEAETVQKLIAEQQPRDRDIVPRVEYFASQAEVREDLRQTHIVIMPSRTEPFGLVAMEAIACRVPVLVSANSGIALLLKEHDMAQLCVQTSAHHPDDTSEASAQADVDAWSAAILGLIAQGSKAFTRAKDLAEKLKRKITDPYSEMIKLGSAPPVFNSSPVGPSKEPSGRGSTAAVESKSDADSDEEA